MTDLLGISAHFSRPGDKLVFAFGQRRLEKRFFKWAQNELKMHLLSLGQKSVTCFWAFNPLAKPFSTKKKKKNLHLLTYSDQRVCLSRFFAFFPSRSDTKLGFQRKGQRGLMFVWPWHDKTFGNPCHVPFNQTQKQDYAIENRVGKLSNFIKYANAEKELLLRIDFGNYLQPFSEWRLFHWTNNFVFIQPNAPFLLFFVFWSGSFHRNVAHFDEWNT